MGRAQRSCGPEMEVAALVPGDSARTQPQFLPWFLGVARFLRTNVFLCLSECLLGSVASNPKFPEAEEVKQRSLATKENEVVGLSGRHTGGAY